MANVQTVTVPAVGLDVIQAAARLLRKVERMTTEDFRNGGERTEREALEDALIAWTEACALVNEQTADAKS